MNPFFSDYLQRLAELHQDIIAAIQDLPPEALDWIPINQNSGDSNSINVLVTHLCGAERYWIGDIACGDPSGRVRAEEFEADGMDAEILVEKILKATDYAKAAVGVIDINDLAVEKSRLVDEKPVSTGWALLHALEHTAIHLGHIQINRQLWDQQGSDQA